MHCTSSIHLCLLPYVYARTLAYIHPPNDPIQFNIAGRIIFVPQVIAVGTLAAGLEFCLEPLAKGR